VPTRRAAPAMQHDDVRCESAMDSATGRRPAAAAIRAEPVRRVRWAVFAGRTMGRLCVDGIGWQRRVCRTVPRRGREVADRRRRQSAVAPRRAVHYLYRHVPHIVHGGCGWSRDGIRRRRRPAVVRAPRTHRAAKHIRCVRRRRTAPRQQCGRRRFSRAGYVAGQLAGDDQEVGTRRERRVRARQSIPSRCSVLLPDEPAEAKRLDRSGRRLVGIIQPRRSRTPVQATPRRPTRQNAGRLSSPLYNDPRRVMKNSRSRAALRIGILTLIAYAILFYLPGF